MSTLPVLVSKNERHVRAQIVQLVHPISPSSLGFYSSSQVNTIGPETLTVQTERIVTIPREVQVVEARQFLRAQLSSVSSVEDILFRVEETDREPGFIADFLIIIPESDREVKRSIFSALGNLMRAYPHLLFDFRIVKRNGRELSSVIPEGYTR